MLCTDAVFDSRLANRNQRLPTPLGDDLRWTVGAVHDYSLLQAREPFPAAEEPADLYLMNILSREAIVARPGFNRWLVPPAAISVHMCIGEVYGFSVFNVPLTLGGTGWTIPQVGWVYSIALAMLGLSAAMFGKWVERSGPRKAMVASCICFCGGLIISAIGVKLKSLTVLYLGYGVIGGIGLGLGYISPVSTLMKWFPDRPEWRREWPSWDLAAVL